MLVNDVKISIVIGGGLALSSTAIVLQVLNENRASSTQSGRLSIATLILQDLTVVPLLIMIPLFAQENVDTLDVVKDAIIQAVAAILVIFIIGIRLLRPMYQAIASLGSQELLTATTLLVVLGAAYASKEAGLSLALGAFIAGLLVAETEFRPQVEADIMPFKGLLMGLFFMSVGMSIDFQLLQEKLAIIILLTFLLVTGKSIIIYLLARAFGFRKSCSIESGFVLAQGSEFAFVLFGLAVVHGVLSGEISQILLIVVSISMALTPMLYTLSKKLVKIIDRTNPVHLAPQDIAKETLDLEGHVIVIGFGRFGKTTCKLLTSSNINYIVIDDNTRNVHIGRRNGFPVYYGTAARMDILKSIGIERARLVVITIDSKMIAKKTTEIIHRKYPDLPIIVRARDRVHAEELKDCGANIAIAELFESSLILTDSVLQHLGIPEHDIDRTIEQFRNDEYKPPIV